MSTQTQIALRPARNPENRTSGTASRATREKPRRKREASPEQKEAAAARRAEIRAMFAKISALPEEKRILLASRLGIRSAEEGREFSICNQLLIAAQCRHASIVGGFDQWRQSGRAVSKGQRAIAIWVPCRRGDSADGATAAPVAPEALAPAAGGDKSSPFFILGNVFDISQTYDIATGEPHPMQALNAPARGPLLLPWTDDTPAPEPAADVAAVVELDNGPADYLADTGESWHDATPAERADYLAQSATLPEPPAEIILPEHDHFWTPPTTATAPREELLEFPYHKPAPVSPESTPSTDREFLRPLPGQERPGSLRAVSVAWPDAPRKTRRGYAIRAEYTWENGTVSSGWQTSARLKHLPELQSTVTKCVAAGATRLEGGMIVSTFSLC